MDEVDEQIIWEEPDKIENYLTNYLKKNIGLIKPKHDRNIIEEHKFQIKQKFFSTENIKHRLNFKNDLKAENEERRKKKIERIA